MIERAKLAATALCWGARRITLRFKGISAEMLQGKANFSVEWSARGPDDRPADYSEAALPGVEAKPVREATNPMEAMLGGAGAGGGMQKHRKRATRQETAGTKTRSCAIL